MPGILKGIAAVITSIGGILLALHTIGYFDGTGDVFPPIIESFDINPYEINSGSSPTLSWSVSDATSVMITPDIGSVTLSGFRTIHPTQNTTYTLLATNKFGSTTAVTVVYIVPTTTKETSYYNDNGESSESFVNSIGMDFVKIRAGEFMMGSPYDEKYREKDEGPVHKVTIEEPFYLGKFEVTQEQWQKVMGNNPSGFKGENLPVEDVSWNDAQEFVKKLNEKEGTDKYRLPSEAEWEYACRAGSTTKYSFGNDESRLKEYAWYLNNSESETHPVGQKKPNLWGLYDMYGNVWEWVQDTYHSDYSSAPSGGSAWVSGGYSHVARGSSFNRPYFDKSPATAGCRSANRGGGNDTELADKGFRLLMEI